MNRFSLAQINALCLAVAIATFLALELVLIEHPLGANFTHDGRSADVRSASCLLRE